MPAGGASPSVLLELRQRLTPGLGIDEGSDLLLDGAHVRTHVERGTPLAARLLTREDVLVGDGIGAGEEPGDRCPRQAGGAKVGAKIAAVGRVDATVRAGAVAASQAVMDQDLLVEEHEMVAQG